MPNNVYIGSRYVPIFKGVWNATLSYEALTIVEYGNNSFTSKRPVPLNTPPTTGDDNDPYWVLTGNYNGQIAHLQDQIDDNTSDITALTNEVNPIKKFITNDMNGRKFIFQGDSYLMRVPTWGDICANDLGLSASQYTLIAEPGSGFVNVGSTGYNFITRFNAEPLIDGITDVVICGGANDRTHSYSDIKTGVANYIAAVKTKYPTARIWVAMPANSKTMADASAICKNCYTAIRDGASENGGIFIEDASHVLIVTSQFSDYLHPSANGNTAIGDCLAANILGGNYKYNTYISQTIEGCEYDANQNFALRAQYNGDTAIYQLTPAGNGTTAITLATPTTINANSYHKLCDIPEDFYFGNYATTSVLVKLRYNTNEWYITSMDVRIGNNEIDFRLAEGVPDIEFIRFGQINATMTKRSV